MKTTTVDLHGIKISDLSKKLDQIVLDCIRQSINRVDLITGRGPLQEKVIELCDFLYGYTAKRYMHNEGVLYIDFE